jgi:DNA-binding response OmpR family regulator
MSLIVVDNERDITEIFRRALELNHFQVDTYNTSHEAIRNFRAGIYDLAVLDFKMPELDGFTLYEKMYKIDKKIRVLFISGDHNSYEAKKSTHPELGSLHYLSKPTKLTELVDRIRQILG